MFTGDTLENNKKDRQIKKNLLCADRINLAHSFLSCMTV